MVDLPTRSHTQLPNMNPEHRRNANLPSICSKLLGTAATYESKYVYYVRFEVSTAVTMMIIIFWEMIIIKYVYVCRGSNCASAKKHSGPGGVVCIAFVYYSGFASYAHANSAIRARKRKKEKIKI
jgi:hypothetical protein